MLSCCLLGSIYVDFTPKKPKIENIYPKVAKKTSGKNANIRHRWSARSYERKKIATAATSNGFMTHLKDLAQSGRLGTRYLEIFQYFWDLN